MNGVIYARYSSDNQREESIEGQIRECLEVADRQGINVVANYIDRAFSAKTDDRPDFQRMIKDSAKHLFDVVIVWKLDRFARNRYDSARNKAILKKNGVRVVSAKENISDRPEGILLEAMLEGYAEFYSAELSEKVIRGMTENALKCKFNGSQIPYGYSVGNDRKYHIEPTEAKVVQEVYRRYADGEPSTRICKDLNARGIRSKTGKDFTSSVIVFMLHNRKYTGEYRFMDIVVPDGMPQIISPELYDRVQKRFAHSRKAPARFKSDVDYLLTTKLYCGRCGAFMAGESGTSGTGETYHYYKCSNAKRGKGCKKKAVRKDAIEYAVVKYTVDHALSEAGINRAADMIIAAQEKGNQLLPALRKRLEENKLAISNLLDAVQKGFYNETVKARMDELEAEKAELEAQMIQEEMQQPNLTRDMVVHWMERFKHGDIRSVKFQKQIIDYFVNAVYVYDDRIVLTYNFKDDSKTITLEEVNRIFQEELTGSSLTSCGEPPKKVRSHRTFFISLKRAFLRILPDFWGCTSFCTSYIVLCNGFILYIFRIIIHRVYKKYVDISVFF